MFEHNILPIEPYPQYKSAADEGATPQASEARLLAKGYNYFATMDETLFTSPAFKGSSTIRTQVGGALTQALLNGNVEKAMADAEAASNLALTK